MEYYHFCVNEKPFCIYEDHQIANNAEYIKRISPKYYEFVNEQNYNIIQDEDSKKDSKQLSAISTRILYAQVLETLFALIYSTIQAPACIHGWMLKYKNFDIYNLVEKTTSNKPMKSKFTSFNNSWEGIIELIFNYFDSKSEPPKDDVVKNFTKLLSSFASDFLDKNLRDEYNSAKHGFRTHPGSGALHIKEVDKEGKPVENAEWRKIIQSDYGSSYYTVNKIQNSENHFYAKFTSNYWNPENLFYGINYACLTIHNLVTFLKAHNKIKADNLNYRFIIEQENYKLPWKNIIGTGSITMGTSINEEIAKIFSDEEIKNSYTK
ncbi:MAG: hypothetical protein GY932_06035 [Arcobacter sp.]|nr:hypothetical protein [Arcobacter sp.]